MSKLEIVCLGSLYGHNGTVTSLVVGKDSNGEPLVVSGGRDKRLIVWKLHLKNPEAVVSDNKNTDEKIVGKPFKSLSGHNHFVSSLDISNDSKFVISGSWDKTIRLWDLNTFKTKKILKGHAKDILSVAFSADSRYIISGSMDNTLKVWNVNGEIKHDIADQFKGWVSSITHVKRQDKNNLIAVGSWDQTVNLYEPKNFTFVSQIQGFDYGVVSTDCDDEGEFMFTAEKNGKIRVHKVGNENVFEPKSTVDVNADLNAISFESKYYMVISCATSKGLMINKVNQLNKTDYTMDASACHCLAWDASKEYLFAGFADGVIRVFQFKLEVESK
jgi:guanine nucleotide-binding protein subunit beta-2-like 1 protein